MNLQPLASRLTKLNGKKKDTSIAQVREDLGNLSDIIFAEGEPVKEGSAGKYRGIMGSPTIIALYQNGARRASRKKSLRRRK